MVKLRENRFRICLVVAGMLALSACQTTTGSGERNVEKMKRAIEQTLVGDDWSVGVEIIRRSHKNAYGDFMPWLKERARTFPPVYLYAMADRMRKKDKVGTVKWYVAARVRHTYDLQRCTNSRAIHRLQLFEQRFHKSVFKYAAKNPDSAYEVALEGLEWDIDNASSTTQGQSHCFPEY